MPSNQPLNFFLHSLNEPHFFTVDIENFRVGIFLAKHSAPDGINEDTLFVREFNNALLVGVADGAGGHPRGHDASQIVGQHFSEILTDQLDDQTNITKEIEVANQKILDLKAGAHSTIALLTLINQQFRCYCVGDSEVIYWNAAGTLIYSNVPHSTVGHEIRAGTLEQEESLDHPDRNYVMNMLGDELIHIEVAGQLDVKKGHTILVGTDGLFDNISHDELGQMVAGGPYEKAFEALVERCVKKETSSWKKDDDIGFILIRKVKSD